jgi:rod shape-determining protein MreD
MHKVIRPRLYLFSLIAVFLQLTLLNRFRVFDSEPDLLFILVIFSGLYFGGRLGLEVGVVSGLLKDLFTADAFGMSAVTFGAAGLAAAWLSPKIYRNSRLTQFFLVLVFYVVVAAGHFFLKSASGGSSAMIKGCYPSFPEFFAAAALPSGLYTSLASLLMLGWLVRRFGFEEYWFA